LGLQQLSWSLVHVLQKHNSIVVIMVDIIITVEVVAEIG
jgi:hypothetical protein